MGIHQSPDLITHMVTIMRHRRCSSYIVEAAAKVIAAEARFNLYASTIKDQNLVDTLFRLLDVHAEVMTGCEMAIKALDSGADHADVLAMIDDLRRRIEYGTNT